MPETELSTGLELPEALGENWFPEASRLGVCCCSLASCLSPLLASSGVSLLSPPTPSLPRCSLASSSQWYLLSVPQFSALGKLATLPLPRMPVGECHTMKEKWHPLSEMLAS